MTKNALEALIKHAGRMLEEHQVARIFKVPEDMVGTPCDFFGYTTAGRAIMIEAKFVSSRSALPIGESPGLAKHQWNELGDANRANVLALIAWRHKKEVAIISMDMAIALSDRRRSIPWRQISDRYKHSPQPSNWRALFRNFLTIPDHELEHR